MTAPLSRNDVSRCLEWLRIFKEDQKAGRALDWGYISMIEQTLESALSEKQATPQGWIQVTERLPEVGIDVLAFNPYNKAVWIEHRERDDEGLDESVTHWMPLPEAPK